MLLELLQQPAEQETEAQTLKDGDLAPSAARRLNIHEAAGGATHYIQVLVRTRSRVVGKTLNGIPLAFSSGKIHALWVTPRELEQLAENDDVICIEPSRRLTVALDRSVPATGANLVHQLSPGVEGAGVIVGIVDSGIDYEHLDFRFDVDGDGVEESSRILAILDQTQGSFGGAEYSRAEIESDLAGGYGPREGLVRQFDSDGHGTHVAGIAAGDGSSSGFGLVGVAPAAWVVVVKSTFFSADILAGVEFVFDIAEEKGLPAVVNLSLGSHDGPHDGTSLLEQGLDELIDGPGRCVVVSAGNEGNKGIHASIALDSVARDVVAQITGDRAEIMVWYPGEAEVTVELISPSGEAIQAIPGASTGAVVLGQTNVSVDNASTGQHPLNGDRLVIVTVTDASAGDLWTLRCTGAEGQGEANAWISDGEARFIGADAEMTIAEPGNAREVVTVGSITTRASWTSPAGLQDYSGTHTLGDLSPFSSLGPTRDGRTKPDLVAPGAWVFSARARGSAASLDLLHLDEVHIASAGTSMAAPHVSGVVALLYSVDDSLWASDIRATLADTASSDSVSGATPNVQWGSGAVDALEAVSSVRGSELPPPIEPERPMLMIQSQVVADVAVFTLDCARGVSAAELRIYDVSRRLVIALAVDGAASAVWSLRTAEGESVASGLYFAVLVTDQGISEPVKLLVQR